VRAVGLKHLTTDEAFLHRLLFYHGVKNRLVDIASGEATKPVLLIVEAPGTLSVSRIPRN
tara:strand:- start:1246 stop:1425 length:180 start_codon:yes stop_codon:yes gene_type:complete